METVLLTSSNDVKLEIVKKMFPERSFNITTINCEDCNLPPQPYTNVDHCAKIRLNYAKKAMFPLNFDYYISIVNGIERFTDKYCSNVDYEDLCHVIIEHKGIIAHSVGTVEFDITRQVMNLLFKEEKISIPELNITGYGRSIRNVYPEHNYDYKGQIESSITDALDQLHKMITISQNILLKYKSKDLYSIIWEPSDSQELLKFIVNQYSHDTIDYIAGLEPCFLGFGLSCIGNYGFIPICKKGKSMNETNDGIQTLEISSDIKPGSRVLLFNDVIATGKKLKASCSLLEQLGCVIVDCLVLREITSLRSIAQNTLGRPYTILLQD